MIYGTLKQNTKVGLLPTKREENNKKKRGKKMVPLI